MKYIGANWVCPMVYWSSAMLTASTFVKPTVGRVVLAYADLRGSVPMTIGKMWCHPIHQYKFLLAIWELVQNAIFHTIYCISESRSL